MSDQHADFFIRNTLVLLAEWRGALAIYAPDAFAKAESLVSGLSASPGGLSAQSGGGPSAQAAQQQQPQQQPPQRRNGG